MTKKEQIYKCLACGNIIEILHEANASLSCCGTQMTEIKENIEEAAEEKHIPIIEKNESNITIKVGSIEHPMDETHYIEWIELITRNKLYRQHLRPGQKPEANFKMINSDFKVRAYCNLHGLWKNS
ncbi:desulfoferrodoxin [archaeon]|jgi:superoxide reductase|nr:desulfoferrodoxin [archaeon]